MAPTGQTITVPAPSDKEIAAYPREYALFRQLDHSHNGQIPLKVGKQGQHQKACRTIRRCHMHSDLTLTYLCAHTGGHGVYQKVWFWLCRSHRWYDTAECWSMHLLPLRMTTPVSWCHMHAYDVHMICIVYAYYMHMPRSCRVDDKVFMPDVTITILPNGSHRL